MENQDVPWSGNDLDAFKLAELDRLGFIRKVYGILSAELFVTVFMSVIVYLSEDYQDWIQENIWLYIICAVGAITILLVLFCCQKVARRVPYNYLLLFLFTIFEAFTLSVFVSYFDPLDSLIALLLTFGITFVLTLYAFTTKTDFVASTAYILVISFALFALAILLLISSSNIVLWVLFI